MRKFVTFNESYTYLVALHSMPYIFSISESMSILRRGYSHVDILQYNFVVFQSPVS